MLRAEVGLWLMREMVLRLYCHNHMLHGELVDLQGYIPIPLNDARRL